MDRQAREVQRLFTSIVKSYDRLNRILSFGIDRRWRRKAASGLALSPGAVVLDLCAGTGDMAHAVRRRCPEAEFILSDFCAPMLDRARRKAGLDPQASYVLCDALDLPLRGARIDAVVCAFGLRNLSDPEAGLLEIHRVLKPAGLLTVLEFFPAARGQRLGLRHWYTQRVLPLLGWAVSGNRKAYSYLPHSVSCFASREEMADSLCRLGFDVVHVEDQTGGICTVFQATKRKESEV